MNPASRPARGPSRAGEVATLLLVFSPVLLPALVVLAIGVALLVLIVAQAFGEGFAVGTAALAAVIGLPSLGLLWLSAVLRTVGRWRGPVLPLRSERPTVLSGMAEIEERYRTGDFIHRDYEAERREWEAQR